ncbi:hypothetical protein PRIEUP_LOCUS1859, partial [Pristimantis euphronides]
MQERKRVLQEEERALQERKRVLQEEERERKQQAQEEERALQERKRVLQEEERERKQQAQEEERALQERKRVLQEEERALQERKQQAQEEERALQERKRVLQEEERERKQQAQEEEQVGAEALCQPVEETPAAQALSLESFIIYLTLGKGAFGKVVQAKDKARDRLVAIKMVKKDSEVPEECYITERTILQMSHQCPYLIHGLGTFETPNNVCYVMEFAAKGNLRNFIWANDPIEPITLKFIMAELVCGVEFLHDHRIIHRDLKPENILVTAAGHVKITDFGLSLIGVSFTEEWGGGTLGYAAPEMVTGKLYGRAVDYFSLGAILYYMCTHRHPFPGSKAKHVDTAEPDYPDSLPHDWLDFLKRLLRKNQYLRLCRKDMVRSHPFFISINWEDVDNFRLQPPDQ